MANSEPLTPVQWTVCVIAAIGFTFDTYELLMLPLVIRPALLEMGIPATLADGTANPIFQKWVSLLFYLPAVLGGVFGLLGGYLTDRLGRRRMLTFSILLYAVSAFLSGFSTTPGMLLFFRTFTFIGVCLEFVAAIAWLAELFPEPHRRERVLGYTQAFGSAGGFLVALVYGWMVYLEQAGRLPAISLPGWLNFFGGEISDPNAAWRYTLMSGLVPALPLIVIRPFLPESPEWQRKKQAGTLKRPSLLAIFSPELRRTTIVTTLMFAFSFGAAFGAIQQMPRMIPGLPEVRALQTDDMSPGERRAVVESKVSSVTKWQEIGGIVGRLLLAVLAVRIVSRRKLLRVFLIPGLIAMPLTFAYAAVADLDLLYVGMFIVALTTIGQFSFWGNYLPRVYPVHLRGTGESCAANIGGRMIGTSFAAITTWVAGMAWVPGETATAKLAYTAAIIGTAVFAANLVLSYFLPEPPPEDAPNRAGDHMSQESTHWARQLTPYHWFVFIIASLAWFFDCLDQRLFSLARTPALLDLMPSGDASAMGKNVTALFLIGWGVGGLLFGPLGDRYGRAKMLTFTVLIYSFCTGLTYFSRTYWDFALFRFLTGMGVGGVFGLAVALIAETLPSGARAGALGWLQILSTVGNISAGGVKIAIDRLAANEVITPGTQWRWMFLVGAVPAFLVVFIMKYLREPEPWLKARDEGRLPKGSVIGPYLEVLRDQTWTRNLVVGALISSAGVVGLWAIGEYATDLQKKMFTIHFQEQGVSEAEIGPMVENARSNAFLLQMAGAAVGMWFMTKACIVLGRKPAFAIWYVGALVVTLYVYWTMNSPQDAYWMMPLMWFFQLGVFAGFAIYLPELFPSRMRSTGTSFCYNLGRFAAAIGSFFSAKLATDVFRSDVPGLQERYAAMAMCSIFVIGLLVLPFAPETKDQPLPEG